MDKVHELLRAVRTFPHPIQVSEWFCKIINIMNQPAPDFLAGQKAAARAALHCSEAQFHELRGLFTQLSDEFKSQQEL